MDIKMNINLFNQDISCKKDKLQFQLIGYFESRYKGAIPKEPKIQNDINSWGSYKIYENLQLESLQEEMQAIDGLLADCPYELDISPGEFKRRFPRESWQLTFELAIASLLKKKFTLKEKKLPPDLEFTYQGQDYFVECTTVATGHMDKYDSLLPEFNKYFYIAQDLYDQEKSDGWWSNLVYYWNKLSDYTIAGYRDSLNKNSNEELLQSIKNWISLNRYACSYFRELIPTEIIIKLKTISFPLDSTSDEYLDVKYIINRIAKSIIDKLKKDYFLQTKIGIIAISFAMFTPSLLISSDLTRSIRNGSLFIHDKKPCLNNLLTPILNELIKKEEKATQARLIQALGNLYAVIIDTNWYNWFPNITRSKYGAIFLAQENCYGILYNQNLQSIVPVNLFEGIILHQFTMPL
jgi:hypothetical protein